MLAWLDRYREKVLGWSAFFSLLLLLIVRIKLPVAEFMTSEPWSYLTTMLQSKIFEDVAGDLLTGFVAAYVFYLLIDFLPRYNRDRETRAILSTQLSSHVETFLRREMSGHAQPLSSFHMLQLTEIQACIDLVDGDIEVRELLSLAYMAKWSHPKLSSSLQLAQTLGLDQFEIWMEITDCVSRIKYLAERAAESGLLLMLRSNVRSFDSVIMDIDPECESGLWGLQMKEQVKKLLLLAKAWHKLNYN